MNTRPVPSAVLFAKDVARLARFYKEVTGMAEIHAASDHVVLEESGFQLVIHGIPEQVAAQIAITDPPNVRENTPIKLCLAVETIKNARSRAESLGGRVFSEGREWEARGFRACDGYDPEGNVFQVRETAA